MGWLHETTPSTKASYVDALLKRIFAPTDSSCTLLDHSLRGNNLWVLVKPRDQEPVIGLFLLRSNQGCWGYKDMDESCGPYYYDCPLRFLDQAPEPQGRNLSHQGGTRSWRDHVRDHHAAAKQRRNQRPKVGDIVVLPADVYPTGYAGTYRVQADLGRKGLSLYPSLRVPNSQLKYVQVQSSSAVVA